jgi:hypothetical protein
MRCLDGFLYIFVFVNEIEIQGEKEKVEGKEIQYFKSASFHDLDFWMDAATKVKNPLRNQRMAQ